MLGARSSRQQRGIRHADPGAGRQVPPDRPDYIGFAASEAPEPGVFAYTFENLTDYVAGLIEAIGLKRYVLYMHDCGGPVGFRLFARAPARVTGFIIQNANAYVEG
jgi:pimeloyl-ACP methyl ester carboxylesterase